MQSVRTCAAARVAPCSPSVAPVLASKGVPLRAELQRASVASVAVREVETITAAPAYTEQPLDTALLHKKLEAKAKALIALEEQAAASWPKVRVRLQKQVGLGEVWKVVGRVPELGRFAPQVAPTMTWSAGHNWTYEGRVRPGTWLFKLVLRRADNAYIWEEGQDRVLNIPETAGPDDTLELVIDNVTLESRRW